MKLKNNVIIAIPIYRRLKENEIFALDNNLQVLNQYDVTFIKPKGLDTQELNKRYPQVKEIEVSDNWLGTKKGIEGYNEMMLSPDFYDLFLEYE